MKTKIKETDIERKILQIQSLDLSKISQRERLCWLFWSEINKILNSEKGEGK